MKECFPQNQSITKLLRSNQKSQKPCILWFTGLSGAGKSTLANLLEIKLHELGCHTYLLDGDNLRMGLNKDLDFSPANRTENIRRVSEVAKLMVDAGLMVIASFISPYKTDRMAARSLMEQGEFVEVFVDVALEIAEQRDTKGLYKKARCGELQNFTGIDSPYERPEKPEIHVNTAHASPKESLELIISNLDEFGLLPRR